MCSSLGASLAVSETTPVLRSVQRCVSWPRSSMAINSAKLAASGLNSSNNSRVPPQGRPNRCASSALMPYFNLTGALSTMALALVYCAMRSSSMQPPDTEPTTAPVSHKAMMEPTGRGDEPQVRTTVVSMARCPASRQALRVRKTTMSKFSILRCRN